MSLNRFKEGECLLTIQKHCPCIEFVLGELERYGFHASQLLDYHLQPNPAAGNEKNAPPEKLTLAFSTADVVLTGWRLDSLADHLRDGELLAVRSLAGRYANIDRSKTYVTAITVTPITKV
jgi:hypothetical protein